MILQRDKYSNRNFKIKLLHSFKYLYFCFIQIDFNDIWIRDWAPISAWDPQGKYFHIKARYQPAYLPKHESLPDNNAGIILSGRLKIPLTPLDLIWDIGNLTHNGIGTAIVTRRILSDNEILSKKIKELFKKYLGINKLILVDEEPYDETGHIDGMVRFINENTLVIGRYTNDYPEGKALMDNLSNLLKKNFNIIRITNRSPKTKKKEGVSSAFGNYINFLRLGNKIFIPQYGIQEDRNAVKAFKKIIPSLEIIPVRSKYINRLADLGGVLNCVSWMCCK